MGTVSRQKWKTEQATMSGEEEPCAGEDEHIPCDGKDPSECMFMRISSKAPRAVHMSFQALGLYPVADAPGDDSNSWWSVCWKGHFKVGDYERALPHQRINHFPKASCISRKDHLLRGIRKANCVHGSIYNISPIAFVLPSEYTKFCDEYANQPENTKATGICKPHSGSQGRNIFIIQNLHDLSYDSQYVIQRYVDRPLLIQGYKFDLRIYVLVTSVHPLEVYIYKEGLTRFSSKKYDMSTLDDVYSHLTNTSINKHVTSGMSGDRKAAIGGGCKWSLKQLREYTQQAGGNWERMWQRIKNVCVLTTMLLVQSVPKGTDACFELYGVDVIIDDQLKPWVLEVNSGPAMGLDEPVDRLVKLPLLQDAIRLVSSGQAARSKVLQQQQAAAARRRPRPTNKDTKSGGAASEAPADSPTGDFEKAFPFDSASSQLATTMGEKADSFKQVVDLIRNQEIALGGTKVHIRSSSASNKAKASRAQHEATRAQNSSQSNSSQAVQQPPDRLPRATKRDSGGSNSGVGMLSARSAKSKSKSDSSGLSKSKGTEHRTYSGLKSSTIDAMKDASSSSSARSYSGLKSSTLDAMKRSGTLSSRLGSNSKPRGHDL